MCILKHVVRPGVSLKVLCAGHKILDYVMYGPVDDVWQVLCTPSLITNALVEHIQNIEDRWASARTRSEYREVFSLVPDIYLDMPKHVQTEFLSRFGLTAPWSSFF